MAEESVRGAVIVEAGRSQREWCTEDSPSAVAVAKMFALPSNTPAAADTIQLQLVRAAGHAERLGLPRISAENASAYAPPLLKGSRDSDDSAPALWYWQMTGRDWDRSSHSFGLEKKRYTRLLPENKQREKQREKKRDRRDRARPEDDSKRRVEQRVEQRRREDAAADAAKAAEHARRLERRRVLDWVLSFSGIIPDSEVDSGDYLTALRRRCSRDDEPGWLTEGHQAQFAEDVRGLLHRKTDDLTEWVVDVAEVFAAYSVFELENPGTQPRAREQGTRDAIEISAYKVAHLWLADGEAWLLEDACNAWLEDATGCARGIDVRDRVLAARDAEYDEKMRHWAFRDVNPTYRTTGVGDFNVLGRQKQIQSITAMRKYSGRSFEELRWEQYSGRGDVEGDRDAWWWDPEARGFTGKGEPQWRPPWRRNICGAYIPIEVADALDIEMLTPGRYICGDAERSERADYDDAPSCMCRPHWQDHFLRKFGARARVENFLEERGEYCSWCKGCGASWSREGVRSAGRLPCRLQVWDGCPCVKRPHDVVMEDADIPDS